MKGKSDRDRPASAPIVAINGLGGLEFMWDGFRGALADHPVRVLDLPGHGGQPPLEAYGYDQLVDDAADRTSDLAAFVLVGWSVGAAVAWLLAARQPQRVTHLVLVEPAAPHQSPFRDGPIPPAEHPYTYASIAKAVDAFRTVDPGVTEQDIERAYRRTTAGRLEPRFDPAILPALVRDARDAGESIYFELEAVSAPTLIVRGEHSFLRPDQVDEIAAMLQDVAVRTVLGAGH